VAATALASINFTGGVVFYGGRNICDTLRGGRVDLTQKIATLIYLTCIQLPVGGDPLRILHRRTGKTRMLGLPYCEESMTIR